MKSSLSCQYENLAQRPGFNGSVTHIKTVVAAVDRVEAKENVADIVAELIDKKLLDRGEVRPVISMIIGQKFPYRSRSSNLMTVTQDLASVQAEVAKWNGLDLVALYAHPDLGVMAVNPKNAARMAQIDRLNRSELLVVYAGRFSKEGNPRVLDAACEALVDLFSGRKAKIRPEFLKGDCVYTQPKTEAETRKSPARKSSPKPAAKSGPRASAKAAAPQAGGALPAGYVFPTAGLVKSAAAPVQEEPKAAVAAEMAVRPGARMTPMYSVLVTNELFHNGNVEAWKRIITSYTTKHPDLRVLVYYDGERITDINALFKWGKVKHGSTIQFAVTGENISDVAKLQRYLAQGASHRFESFLKGPVNSVMALF